MSQKLVENKSAGICEILVLFYSLETVFVYLTQWIIMPCLCCICLLKYALLSISFLLAQALRLVSKRMSFLSVLHEHHQ